MGSGTSFIFSVKIGLRLDLLDSPEMTSLRATLRHLDLGQTSKIRFVTVIVLLLSIQ